MIITSVKIRNFNNSGNNMIGVCSIILDNLIAIHDIKILKKNGYFLAMPSRKTNSNTYKDIVHPISEGPRKKIEEIVLGLYDIVIKSKDSSVEFKCINTDCCSMLEQVCSDFKQEDKKSYHDYINDEIKKEIQSWMV